MDEERPRKIEKYLTFSLAKELDGLSPSRAIDVLRGYQSKEFYFDEVEIEVDWDHNDEPSGVSIVGFREETLEEIKERIEESEEREEVIKKRQLNNAIELLQKNGYTIGM